MKKTKLTFFDLLLLLLALALAVVLIVGALASNYDPRQHKFIPFFGLAYPYLLFLNLLMIICWCLRKRWWFALGTLVVILSGWQALSATIRLFGDEGIGPKPANSIRMMTYNVHGFRPYDQDINEPVKEQMLDLIKNENPDVICFQEYFTRRKGPYDITDSLREILNVKHHYFVPFSENDYEANGLAIFSKYPIVDKGTVVFNENYGGNASIYVDIEVNKQVIRIYNVHMQSISFGKEDYEYLDKVTTKMDAELTPTRRIARMLWVAFTKRAEQVDIMKQTTASDGVPFIIAGDFNDTPASYAVTQMTSSLNNAFKIKGSGMGSTYNGKFPNFQIDYIATTKDINVLNYHVIKAKLSDHFPVRSDLRLNP